MEKKSMIDNISNRIIPINITATYNYMLELMSQISYDYHTIEMNTDVNSNNYSSNTYLKANVTEKMEEKDKLRKEENTLIVKKREYQDRLSIGKELNTEEIIEYNGIDKNLNEIHKKEQVITRELFNINKAITKNDSERLEIEKEIEESRNRISNNINILYSLIKNINTLKLGLERIDGFKVKPTHIKDLHGLIEKEELFKEDSNLLETQPLIDSLFVNSIDLRIEYYKEIYNEAFKLLDLYKKGENLDFSKIDQLTLLKNSQIEDLGNIYSPVNQKWNYEKPDFLQTYVELIEEIKNTIISEPTKEQVLSLKSKWDKLIKEDIQYFTLNIYALGKYINELANKYLKEDKKLTV